MRKDKCPSFRLISLPDPLVFPR